jgi:hypothetical protein
MRKFIVAAFAAGLILSAGAVCIGILLTENAALLRHLQETEELLRSERQAAADSEARHSSELMVMHMRQDEDRRILAEQHDAVVRSVTAEALRVQVDLMTQGFRLVPPQGSRFVR